MTVDALRYVMRCFRYFGHSLMHFAFRFRYAFCALRPFLVSFDISFLYLLSAHRISPRCTASLRMAEEATARIAAATA